MQGYLFEREKREKPWVNWKNILIVVIYLAIVCGVVIGAIFFLGLYQKKDDVCVTENCLKTADLIVSSMDTSKSPCDDFYEFTCGNFIDHAVENNIPSQYYAQKQKIQNKLNAIITEPIFGEEESIYLQLKRFYQSCMNVEAIDEAGFEPFKILLKEIGGWPLIEGQLWNETNFDLNEVILKCMDLGLPFQWFFELTFKNQWVDIHAPKIVMPYQQSYQESAYLNLISEVAVHFGASKIIALNQTEKVFQFERDFNFIVAKHNENRSFSPLTDLNSTFSIILWPQILNHIQENSTLPEYIPHFVFNEEYLIQLNLLLARTPKRTLANFIVYKILQEFGFYLASPIRDMFLNVTDFVKNGNTQNTRFEFCRKEVLSRFPRIAETEFLYRYIDGEKVNAVKDIISNIKKQFISRLNTTEWIDEETREIGINKVNNIIEIIGQHYLDNNEEMFRNFLQLTNLEFTTDNITDMIREKNKDSFKQQFETQNNAEIDDPTKFFFEETMNVNAEYFERDNILFLTAGIIQDIFHDSNRPNYLNYAALGSVIAHEIAHAFRQIATTHDSDKEKEIMTSWFNGTNLKGIDEMVFLNITYLWQENNLEALNSLLNCVINDMRIFKSTGYEGLDLTENVADLIGIDIAYEAYTAWAEEYETEQNLPGLPFSPKQMFWIYFGAINCYKNLDTVRWSINDGTHYTLRYKVQNTIKNSRNFAEDFQCPEGSVMNPIEKCHIF